MAKKQTVKKARRGNDARRKDSAYRVVQDLNDAGLLREPWTQWGAAVKIVNKALREKSA